MAQGAACNIGDWRSQSHFKHVVSGPRELERLNATGAIAIDFRPATRPFRSQVSIQGAQSRTFCLWTTSSVSGFMSVPKHAADVITIRFVVDGRMIRRNGRMEHTGLPGLAMFVAFEEMNSEEASVGFHSFGGTISRSGFLRGHQALNGVDAPVPDLLPVVPADTMPMRAFALSFTSLMGRLADGVAMDDYWLSLLEEVIVYQLLTAWRHRDGDRLRRPEEEATSSRMRLAVDFIEENLASPFLLEDVARVADVSVRTLQSGFRKLKNCSPTQFITTRRLEQVRSDLETTDRDELTVADAAKRWGFSHMGDFSRRYREEFGFLPRATKRKSGGPSGR